MYQKRFAACTQLAIRGTESPATLLHYFMKQLPVLWLNSTTPFVIHKVFYVCFRGPYVFLDIEGALVMLLAQTRRDRKMTSALFCTRVEYEIHV